MSNKVKTVREQCYRITQDDSYNEITLSTCADYRIISDGPNTVSFHKDMATFIAAALFRFDKGEDDE